MDFYLPIFSNVSSFSAGGRYRIWFRDVKNFDLVPSDIYPKDYVLVDSPFNMRVYEVNKFPATGKLNMIVELIEKPVSSGVRSGFSVRTPAVAPVLLIIIGLVAALGLSLLNMTFDKVEKIIDNPVIQVVIVVGLIFAVYLLVRYTKKGK